jgi:hypothetical protein
MSPREKKLILFFALAGFAVLNFVAIGFVKSARAKVDAKKTDARVKLETAEHFRASREQVTDQMDWLAEHESEPAANQDVQTKLQQLSESAAKSTGLTIKSQKPLPTEKGAHYHRAKLEITVTGSEEALYKWFDRLNMPDQFRIASRIRLSPNSQDDTKIDCTATVEQWFLPSPSA